MKKLKILLSIFIALLSICLQAQEKSVDQAYVDELYLKNGSVFRGVILEYKQGELVRFELYTGDQLVFREGEIERVVQNKVVGNDLGRLTKKQRKQRRVKTYEFSERGVYNVTYFAALPGRFLETAQLGAGLHNVTGFQFNRWFGLGLGLGVDNYSLNNGESFYPLYAEFRGYLRKSIKAPYYSFSAGYGFAFSDSSDGILDAKGGLMLHPAIGIRLGAGPDANVLMDIGYSFQKATIKRELWFSGDVEIREMLYKRLNIRLGLIF